MSPAIQRSKVLRCAARFVEALVTVSALMGIETIGRMKGLSPRATSRRDGKVTYPRYTLFPHRADDADFPFADDADDDVAAPGCQDATAAGTWSRRRVRVSR
jgi:hypothetical protein